MNYEKKLAELENLVKKLEEGGLTLEESIAVFEKGVTLTKECLGALNEYKGKISSIQDEMDKLLSQD